MDGMEDHKKELDADFRLVHRKNMRRGKPQQEIYKPGSGKLRRSHPGLEDSTLEVGGSPIPFVAKEDTRDEFGESNIDTHKRTKKPERKIYVPKVVAEHRGQLSPHSFSHESGGLNGTENLFHDKMNRSKRYSNSRNASDSNNGRSNNQNEWRDKSPSRNNFRMGSEPRGGYNSNNSNYNHERDKDRNRNKYRERDTRSVEPSGGGHRNNNPEGGKIASAKPPTGRRHSTTGNYHFHQNMIKNLENLPPRLKRKFMEDNGLTPEDLRLDCISNSSGFYPNTSQQHHQNSGYHSLDSYSTLPHAVAPPAYNHNPNYHTLPGKTRGRGRFNHHDSEPQLGVMIRPITPDRVSPGNSRPDTPTRRFDNKPPSRPPSRSQTPLSHYDDNRSTNESWNDRSDRRPSRSNVIDRLSGRPNDPKQSSRDRDKRNDDNYTRRDKRNDSDRREFDKDKPDRDRTDHYKRADRRKKSGRERRSSSRDLTRYGSKDSGLSNDSASTLTGEITDRLPSLKINEDFHVWQSEKAVSEANSNLTKTVSLKIESADFELAARDRNILDWNEEVELNHRLEAEALSDALTRSSSVVSLHDTSTKSMPASAETTPGIRKNRKGTRRKSKQGSSSGYRDRTPTNRDGKDSYTSVENQDNFKVPQESGSGRHGRRRRRSSRDHRDSSFERFGNKSRGPSREVSFDRSQTSNSHNWRDEIIRSRQNSDREGSALNRPRSPVHKDSVDGESRKEPVVDSTAKKGGILILPANKSLNAATSNSDRPKFPDIRQAPSLQRTLFDPKNPTKPILVKSPGGRVSGPGVSDSSDIPKMDADKLPVWYNESSEDFNMCYFPDLLRDIKRADVELQCIISKGLLLMHHDMMENLRKFLQSALEYLLSKSIKFCQIANLEQHLWKLLYYNIIEVTRKALVDDPENKQQYKAYLLYIIDDGTKYFERLIGILEETYKFKVVNYVGNNSMVQHKGLGLRGLALISAQKIYLFLGDLGRYKEQVNETSNYGKCRQWYIKSHEINPKNGKPYNRLAVLAVSSRRKLDAVYYYMRSLMSSNPVPTAKQDLVSLFDENRKKYLQQIYYEQGEKKRREERLERQRQHMKQKESEENGAPNFLRKETWIRPDGGRRLHRTTKASQEETQDSEEEDLAALSSVDVNKRFITSYLHVHGKLITKIGMESFQDAAMQMLKEFRALLQHSPVSLPCNRFLQLLALNMFAIDSTQLKDPNLQQLVSYRSELQERALIVSLQMFNLILERCVSILEDHCSDQEKSGLSVDSLPHDANVLLPAIKVWCDWMLCHTSVWNPPPSTHDFKVGPPGDLWSRLGLLMNILEQMDQGSSEVFINDPKEGYEQIRLPEDATLCGFTPLIFHDREPSYAPSSLESESAQLRLRISKLIFFGTVFLCGLEPPVLKLEIEDGRREYVSVVSTDRGRDSPRTEAVLTRSDEVLLETFSGDEEDAEGKPDIAQVNSSLDTSSEVKDLLTRKLELEKRNRSQERHQQRVMKILSQSIVSVHLEIRPKYLVPDTNCFIDHLDSIHTVAKSHTYTLMVPTVVLSELEGLSKGNPPPTSKGKFSPSPEHVQKVAEASRAALEFLKTRHAAVKCVTTKGAVLPSMTFSVEDDATWDVTVKNDDKILDTCLILCKNHGKEQSTETKEGEPRHLFREVVLLTEDRNLRVKAHARDVPVRALPDFMRWASLGG
ncbi:telomerase-binding protein EST1A isoform X2 [Euwallacea similis]|uniref:telomerase-binding protein EST1A isoform X2 n=1 Tax=Euwallacea similis TaxID=1736056 RepID=UPI0034505530